MNLKQAERIVRLVSLLNFISIFISIISISIPLSYFPAWLLTRIGPLPYFMPWLFPRDLAAGIVIVIFLTVFVYFNRSRVASILLLVVFILDKYISIILLFLFPSIPQLYPISWLCITLIWGLVLIYGIKATFVYHRLKRQQPAIPESDGK